MFLTRPLKMPPTMLRSVMRSTVYSSSTPSSSRATRRSSFSTLMSSRLDGFFFAEAEHAFHFFDHGKGLWVKVGKSGGGKGKVGKGNG